MVKVPKLHHPSQQPYNNHDSLGTGTLLILGNRVLQTHCHGRTPKGLFALN